MVRFVWKTDEQAGAYEIKDTGLCLVPGGCSTDCRPFCGEPWKLPRRGLAAWRVASDRSRQLSILYSQVT